MEIREPFFLMWKEGGKQNLNHGVSVLEETYKIEEPLLFDKRIEVVTQATTWMSLENVLPSARSQSQRNVNKNCPRQPDS